MCRIVVDASTQRSSRLVRQAPREKDTSLLGRRLEDEVLRTMYADLAAQEARHHTLYTGLAREYFDAAEVRARLDELALAEVAAVDASAGFARLHSP